MKNIRYCFKYCFFLTLLSLCTNTFAQLPEKIENTIKTIQLYKGADQLNYPIIYLNSSDFLTLRFDDLTEVTKNYRCTFMHCNANWEPSNIPVNRYLNGFEENDIRNYSFSRRTNQKYIHYEYTFPNNNISFLASGNYMIKVFTGSLNSDDEQIYFTARFCIVDSKVGINAEITQPILYENKRSKQKIGVNIKTNANIDYPSQNIKVQVSQNGRIDNMLELDKPQYIKDDELIYGLEDNVFDGGNEFQFFDIRSNRFYSNTVYEIKTIQDTVNIYLRGSQKRAHKRYFFEQQEDMNGNYFISRQETDVDNNTEADYSLVHFHYAQEAKASNPLYLLGRFTNWQALPEYELIYNENAFAYELKTYLKQGFYDYQIVEKLPNNKLDLSFTEGNYYQTNNQYMVFVFYKGFSDLYDHLIGFDVINSNLR